MSQLIELNNVERLLNEAEPITNEAEPFTASSGLVLDVGGLGKSIFKFKEFSVCEVFGYQLASAIGLRVPSMRGVWTREVVRTAEDRADPGRIGILVEYLNDWKPLSFERAAARDSLAVAQALALCVFDRDEWGEFGLSGHKVYFVDLERLLPRILPEVLFPASEEKCAEWLHNLEVPYNQGDSWAIGEVLKEAEKLGLQEQVRQELQRLCSLNPDTYYQLLEISGHPLGGLLSRFASCVFGTRLNSISEWFDLPTHKVPAWR
jgi:hypothetical protein